MALPPIFARRIAAFAGPSLESKVLELADREAIRDLVATYAHRMAQGTSAADLFTDDGTYINRGAEAMPACEVHGREALDDLFCERSGWAERPLPMIHNQLIEVRGNEAIGICSVEIRLAAEGVSYVVSGTYRDRFRRDKGVWKFAEREASFFHWVPLSKGWAKPVESKA